MWPLSSSVRRQLTHAAFPRTFRIATLTLAAVSASVARADDWTGFPSLILGVLLIPTTVIALVFVALAFVRKLHGAVYVASTVLFLPIAWYGFTFFSGASTLAAEKQFIPYYVAMGVLAICTVSYVAIAFRYWCRYITIGPMRK